MDESKQNVHAVHADIFRNLVSDSKLLFLCRAVEQYEQAQVQLRLNEDRQRRVEKFIDYNNLKLLELELARQRILQSASAVAEFCMNGNGGSGSAYIPVPSPADEKEKPQAIIKARETTTKNRLPLQRPSKPTITKQLRATNQAKRSINLKLADSSVSEMDGIKKTVPAESILNNSVIESNAAQSVTTCSTLADKIMTYALKKPQDFMRCSKGSLDRADNETGVDIQNIMEGRDLLWNLRNINALQPLQIISDTTRSEERVLELHQQLSSHGVPNPLAITSKESLRTVSSQESLSGTESEGDHGYHNKSDDDCRGLSFNASLSYNCSMTLPHSRYSFNFQDADVLFERGNFAHHHIGNKVYREYIKSLQDDYMRCKKQNKHLFTIQVFNHIKVTCKGRFLAFDAEGSKKWVELSEEAARRKIGQSLREKNKRYIPPPRSRKNGKPIYDMFDYSNAIQGS